MGQRQQALQEIVSKEFGFHNHPKPVRDFLLNSRYGNEIRTVYKQLDGVNNEPRTKFGKWDISTKDFIIELDEERHFNRYRLITLKSNFYKNNKCFSVNRYKQYCKNHEMECVSTASWGKNWKNDSTEKQFGKSSEPGNFEGRGSSRWKQRAFYDFLKDVTSELIGIPIIRISIYDSYQKETVDDLLMRNNTLSEMYLIASIKEHKLLSKKLPFTPADMALPFGRKPTKAQFEEYLDRPQGRGIPLEVVRKRILKRFAEKKK